MFLMSLMFLYIRVLPHILNIPWQTQFSYVIKNLTSKSVFLRALCIQVLCVLTFSSSMPFVALAFCPGPWPLCLLLALSAGNVTHHEILQSLLVLYDDI